MPLLVIAVDDLDTGPARAKAARTLTPFVAVVAGGRSAREQRAREA